ncbi:MAG: T9SS type A sorting domain-containing protein [Chitinophagaceae bacterium]|nr:T9SS type A sorting domain-containing protein [Chitinophagaceae bacterium]
MRIFYVSFILLLLYALPSAGQEPKEPERNPYTRIVKFYPNPATTIINFDFQKDYDKNYSFQIFNFLGKKVFEINSVNLKTIVNLNDFYRGIYIFQLRDKNQRIVDSGKFQVVK